MKKTPWIIGAATVAVLAVGGGGTAYAVSSEAAVTVYGKASSVRTFSSPTVAELLESQGITVQENDLVTPGLDETVTDGMDIQVIQRHLATVTIDGAEKDVLTTGTTVQDALDELDYKAEGAKVTPAPETELSATEATAVDVSTLKTVTFTGQYGSATFETTAKTVDEAMTSLLTNIEDSDTASVERDALLEDGATIEVHRTREKERTETEEIPFETTTKKDDTLLEGTTRTTTEGKKGSKEIVYKDTVVDGKTTESEKVSEKVTAEPVAKVVVEGTKKAPVEEKTEEKAEESASSSSSASTSRSTTESSRSSERSSSSEKESSSDEKKSSSSSKSDDSSSEKEESSSSSSSSAPSVSGGSVWDKLAKCESGGNWSINTGNGFYGGLQFTKSTWLAYGGGQYASNAHLASREQQIAIGKKVQAGQGWGAWPSCTSQLGIR